MNFLRSVLIGDGPSDNEAEMENENENENEDEPVDVEEQEEGSSSWGFADVMKTLASKSEEVLATYQRDLQEFGFSLKKETETVVDATSSAISDLPQQLASGRPSAQVAVKTAGDVVDVLEESLESVGQTIEDIGSTVWKSTTEIFAQVRDAVAQVEEEAQMNAKPSRSTTSTSYAATTIARGKYSRYEAQVSAMQRDSSTYCDEPDDVDDFANWKSTFSLVDKKGDVEALLKENAFMQELQLRIVPVIVEYDTFWTRYYYRLHKLQLAEDARADLVKRATTNDEEELSWDVEEVDTPLDIGPVPRSIVGGNTAHAAAAVGEPHVETTPSKALEASPETDMTSVPLSLSSVSDGEAMSALSVEDQSKSDSRSVAIATTRTIDLQAAGSDQGLSEVCADAVAEVDLQAAVTRLSLVQPPACATGVQPVTPVQEVSEEVESKSEASGGSLESDWLVVDDKSEGKPGVGPAATPVRMSDRTLPESDSDVQVPGGDVAAGQLVDKEMVHSPDNQTLSQQNVKNDIDELEDLEVDDEKLEEMVIARTHVASSKPVSMDGKAAQEGEQEEDWGEWE